MAKKSFTNALTQTGITEKTGIRGVFSSTEKKPIETPVADSSNEPIAVAGAAVSDNHVLVSPDEEPDFIRQTFLIDTADFEKLKDIVFFKKTSVDFDYSQKQALHEAIEMLYNSLGPISARPEYIRKKEKAKTASLKKKLQAKRAK